MSTSVSGTQSQSTRSPAVAGPATADAHQRNMERNQSVTRTLLAVSISFTICWMPLHILNALIDVGLLTNETHSEHLIYLLIAICSSVAMTSVPLNALLYGWYNPSINREVINWRLIANASAAFRSHQSPAPAAAAVVVVPVVVPSVPVPSVAVGTTTLTSVTATSPPSPGDGDGDDGGSGGRSAGATVPLT